MVDSVCKWIFCCIYFHMVHILWVPLVLWMVSAVMAVTVFSVIELQEALSWFQYTISQLKDVYLLHIDRLIYFIFLCWEGENCLLFGSSRGISKVLYSTSRIYSELLSFDSIFNSMKPHIYWFWLFVFLNTWYDTLCCFVVYAKWCWRLRVVYTY